MTLQTTERCGVGGARLPHHKSVAWGVHRRRFFVDSCRNPLIVPLNYSHLPTHTPRHPQTAACPPSLLPPRSLERAIDDLPPTLARRFHSRLPVHLGACGTPGRCEGSSEGGRSTDRPGSTARQRQLKWTAGRATSRCYRKICRRHDPRSDSV